MKKLLGFLGAMGLTASSLATGVAMSPIQNTNIQKELHEIFSRVLTMGQAELEQMDDDYLDWLDENLANEKFKETYWFLLDFSDFYNPNFNPEELPEEIDQDLFNEIYTVYLENLIVSIRLYEIYNGEKVGGILLMEAIQTTGKLLDKTYVTPSNQLFSQNIFEYVS